MPAAGLPCPLPLPHASYQKRHPREKRHYPVNVVVVPGRFPFDHGRFERFSRKFHLHLLRLDTYPSLAPFAQVGLILDHF